MQEMGEKQSKTKGGIAPTCNLSDGEFEIKFLRNQTSLVRYPIFLLISIFVQFVLWPRAIVRPVRCRVVDES